MAKVPFEYGVSRLAGNVCPGSTKAAFKRESRKFLKAIGGILSAKGWTTAHLGFDESGTAGAGDASAVYYAPDGVRGVYIKIGDSFGIGSASPSGICIMYRATRKEIQWTGLTNHWDAPYDISPEAMAAKLEQVSFEALPNTRPATPPVAVGW